jgi:nucleotide-binding universal stress UspA family protein
MSELALVVLRQPDCALDLLKSGGQFARLLNQALVKVLAVREPIARVAHAAEALITEADALLTLRQAETRRIGALKAAYDAWAGGEASVGLSSRWIEVEGSASATVGELGSRADVVVCSRPFDADHLLRQELSAALFGTDRPVLVIPPGRAQTLGKRVAIAWREEKRSVRAVIPALRWLTQAEETHLFIGVRDEKAAPSLPSVFAEHGVHPRLHVLRIGSEPFGATLLEKAHALSIDLLIMGAYVHSPLRGLLLGGVTRHVLAHADLPVLMRH